MVKYVFFVACVLFGGDVSGNIITPCKVTDKACILSSANSALPKIIAGIPELGVPSSDPLHVDFINGDLSILKYTFKDFTATGLKNCVVKEFDLNLEKNKLDLVTVCPDTVYTGQYTLNGRLIVLPVTGEGSAKITGDKYQLTINAEIKKVQGKDGKDHLNIKNFKVKADAVERVVYDFKNLFNGQKDLADNFHKFGNENYREVSDIVSGPIFTAIIKDIFKNVNKYLKSVPFEELFLA